VPDVSAADVMFVANHISWLDIYLLDAVCPVRFVAKAEVRAWPVVGWLAVKIGTLFIERTRRHDTARAGREVVDALRQGDCVAVFPEGTTSNGTLLRPFHASLLQSAIDGEAMVWPVAIRYQHRDGTANLSPAYVDNMSFADSLFRILDEPELEAEITYLEPLPVQGRSRRELAALAEKAIANALNLTAPGRKSGKPVDPPAALP
jgi:1-acyl-sn-glycerol-3-phosphate acyltransferase